MGVPSTLDSGHLTPDACRRSFHARRDISLGLLPQLLLDERSADVWGYFWYAARVVDDEIEAGRWSAADTLARIARPTGAPIDEALANFFAGLPAHLSQVAVKADLARAVEALGTERSWTRPPSMRAYADVVRAKAGVPLSILNGLLLRGEDPATLARFSQLLAASIQIGDDVRDRVHDATHGLQTITSEEIELAQATRPDDPEPVARLVPGWREAAAQWLAILALERAERFQRPESRANARIEVLLWLRAIESGQLHTQQPLRWPGPLDALLRDAAPSSARMAAARRVLHEEPAVLGDVTRWQSRNRMQELQRVQASLPGIYAALDPRPANGGL